MAFVAGSNGKGTPKLNSAKRIPKKKKFNGTCFNCDDNCHTIKDCLKRMADEKSTSNKTSWRKPELANNVMDELELWVAMEMCSLVNTQVVDCR